MESFELDGHPLPEMHDAMLDEATLGQLAFDIASSAKVLEVRTKAAASAYALGAPAGLTQAIEGLVAGTVLGVQVRYLFDNTEWCDTLLRVPEGVRLVRVKASG
jgi:hypothetical protein